MKQMLWKSMKSGLMSNSGNIGSWVKGEWRTHDKSLKMCQSGFHASVRAIDAMRYVDCEVLALVEVKGKHLEQDDKQAWEKMRVVKAYEWTKKDSVGLAIFCAELVIGIYEKKHPDDKRPRKAIEAAKAWIENPTEENSKAAASASASAASVASAAYADYNAAYSDYVAASAVASVASVAYAASATYADAPATKKETLDKVEAWIQERIKGLKVAK